MVARRGDVYRVAYIGERKSRKYMMLMQSIAVLRNDKKQKSQYKLRQVENKNMKNEKNMKKL